MINFIISQSVFKKGMILNHALYCSKLHMLPNELRKYYTPARFNNPAIKGEFDLTCLDFLERIFAKLLSPIDFAM